MPTFEIETGGGTFEIEAPDMQSAIGIIGQMPDAAPSDVAAPEPAQPEVSSGGAFVRSAFDSVANNIMAIPDTLATGIFRNPFSGDITPPGPEDSLLPRPTMNDVRAGGVALTGGGGGSFANPRSFGERFDTAIAEQEQIAQRNQEGAPVASVAGDLAGDALTIFAGRAPFQKAARRAPAKAAPKEVPAGVRNQINKIFRNNVSKGLGKGFRRAGETGVEGAVIAALNQGDPATMAAIGAGSQGAASIALTMAKHPLKALLPAVASATALIQMSKTVTPGGNNFILESVETAFDKTAAAYGLGILSAVAGGGRLFGTSFSKNLPKITDAVTSLPRGAVLSAINDITSDEPTRKVVETFAKNPTLFDAKSAKEIARAMRSEKRSLKDTIAKLMENPEFARRFELNERFGFEGQSVSSVPSQS